jgi:hypothetical protein
MKIKSLRDRIASALAIVLLISSCTNLDEEVYDKLPADDFGSTEVEVKALMGTVYNTLKDYWPSNFMYLSECAGSMAVTPTRLGGDWYDGGQYREMYMHTYTAETTMGRDAWNAANTALGTCNATIDVLNNSDFLTDEQKTEHISSMRGMRAFWVYAMMDVWGNIPIVTDYADKELPSNRPRQEIFDWILSELLDIADSCPAGIQSNYGRFTSGSAYFLLAKLYLNAAAWGVSVSGNAYERCISACDRVMSMGYVLEPEFATNFGVNDRSREGILTICFSEGDTEKQNQLMNRTLHYQDNKSDGANYAAWNGVCAQPDYVKLFDESDPRYAATFRIGQRYDRSTGEILLTGHGNPLNYTVDFSMLPGTGYDGGPWGDVVQEAGARCQKWPYPTGLTNAMGNHFHIFRYSDVYLMKAEALLRSDGDVVEATRLVNLIRSRAYGDASHNYDVVDLPRIQLERRFEFAWESWSRQDDIRFSDYTRGYWSSSNCPRSPSPHLTRSPRPPGAWQTNPRLLQNPGYPAF